MNDVLNLHTFQMDFCPYLASLIKKDRKRRGFDNFNLFLKVIKGQCRYVEQRNFTCITWHCASWYQTWMEMTTGTIRIPNRILACENGYLIWWEILWAKEHKDRIKGCRTSCNYAEDAFFENNLWERPWLYISVYQKSTFIHNTEVWRYEMRAWNILTISFHSLYQLIGVLLLPSSRM